MHLSRSVPVCVTWNDLVVPKCHLLHLSWLRLGAILDFIALFLLAAILLFQKEKQILTIIQEYWKDSGNLFIK